MCFSRLESTLILTLVDPQWILYVESTWVGSLLPATENSEASRSPGGSRLWLGFFPVTQAPRPVLNSAGQSGLPTACPAILHMRTVGAASNISGCVGAWGALCWQGGSWLVAQLSVGIMKDLPLGWRRQRKREPKAERGSQDDGAVAGKRNEGGQREDAFPGGRHSTCLCGLLWLPFFFSACKIFDYPGIKHQNPKCN